SSLPVRPWSAVDPYFEPTPMLVKHQQIESDQRISPKEIATRADSPAAPGAHRESGAARRPSDARMRGRGRAGCPPRLLRPYAVRRCRPDRRTDRTMRAAWPGNTAPGATRSTRRHTSVRVGITKSSEVILAFGVSALAHAVAAQRVCANLSGTSSVSVSNFPTTAPPIRGYASMAGLKYRWNISPKKSYSCSLIALLQVSDGHLNCAPVPSAEQRRSTRPEQTRGCRYRPGRGFV